MKILVLLTSLGLVGSLFVGAAAAQEPTALPEVRVHATPPRPTVHVVLTRSRASHERREDRTSFTREIVSSATRAPF